MKHTVTNEDDIIFLPRAMSTVCMSPEKYNPKVQEEVEDALRRIDNVRNLDETLKRRKIYEEAVKATLDEIEKLNQKTTKGLNARNYALIEVIVKRLLTKQ